MTEPNEIISTAAAVDFESYFSSDYSIRDLGNYGYTHHPEFDAYLVSIVTKDFRWVGHPKDAPWDKIADLDWVSWNQGFDGAVYDRLIELSVIPNVRPRRWHCAANCCVYHQIPRALASAVQAVYNVTISKSVRDKDMKGKHWADFSLELQTAVKDYALADSDWCLRLWNDYAPTWPEKERRLSELTYAMGMTGLPIDLDGVHADIKILERVKFEALQRIPWREDYVPLSPRGLAEECRKVGINPPASLAADDEECAQWEETYGEQYPWVAAMRDYRRSNAILEKYKTMRDRTRPDGTMPYSLLYGGAPHTMRWSGSGGWNAQNLPKEPFYIGAGWTIIRDKKKLAEISKTIAIAKKNSKPVVLPEYVIASVDMRSKIRAPRGKKLIICDLAQIEARVTPWLAGDRDTLELARKGISVYEIHGRTSMGWTGGEMKKENPKLYALAKARVLGLGFQCGDEKFVSFARGMLDDETFDAIFASEVSPDDESRFLDYKHWLATRGKKTERSWTLWKARWDSTNRHDQLVQINSWLQVQDFRKKNPKITALWKKLGDGLKSSIGSSFEAALPSGRSIRFFTVTNLNDDGDVDGSIRCRTTRGDHFIYTHGGKLLENCVQGTARDVFAESLLRIHDAGHQIILHVHDEAVVLADESLDKKVIEDLMTIAPDWATGLPVGAEGMNSLVYTK